MRQRNPKGRYIEGEIGKGNTHTKFLQVSLELYTSRLMQCIFGEREQSNCVVYHFSRDDTVKFLPTAEFQLFEAHCLDKRAYLCWLLRWLEDDWIRFPAVSKARHWSAIARERYVHTYTHVTNGTRGGV